MKTIDPQLFRDAMRLTASGVAVITTDGPLGRAGLTVSSLCSLSMEPPSVVCCVHRDNRALAVVMKHGMFAANILASHQAEIANVFAGLVPESRGDRFATAEWYTLESPSPVLKDAICGFDCCLVDYKDFGSHRILIGEVTALTRNAASPLVYSDRTFHRTEALPVAH